MHFVHLRTHTEFSVVDGTLRVDDAVQAAAKDGQVAMAITDLSNLFGGVKFYNAARKKGVQPLLGADVWLEPDAETRPASRLLLLVQDRTGYLNLCEILSRAWITNVQRNNQAWVRWDWLAELGQGLIALSGGLMGAVGQALAVGDAARARELAERQAALFPDRFYLELQRAQLPGQDAHVRATVPLAAQLDARLQQRLQRGAVGLQQQPLRRRRRDALAQHAPSRRIITQRARIGVQQQHVDRWTPAAWPGVDTGGQPQAQRLPDPDAGPPEPENQMVHGR